RRRRHADDRAHDSAGCANAENDAIDRDGTRNGSELRPAGNHPLAGVRRMKTKKADAPFLARSLPEKWGFGGRARVQIIRAQLPSSSSFLPIPRGFGRPSVRGL